MKFEFYKTNSNLRLKSIYCKNGEIIGRFDEIPPYPTPYWKTIELNLTHCADKECLNLLTNCKVDITPYLTYDYKNDEAILISLNFDDLIFKEKGIVTIDYTIIKKIFKCNGIYDGKSFYLIDSFKEYGRITKRELNSLRDRYSDFISDINYFCESYRRKGKKHSVRQFINIYRKSLNINAVTKYIDEDMKSLFKLKLVCSENDFVVFDIIENENSFDIDIDSIH